MIDVMILTKNEAANLPRCLEALQGWTRHIFVIDSGSTDDTRELARAAGATVVEQPWLGYARQKNWGLETLPLEAPWTLIVDADEVITADLRDALLAIAKRPADEVPENGFFINRLTYFLGSPIRHCGYFPNWNLRFFKRGKARYEDRPVHEHMIIEQPIGYVKTPMDHYDHRDLQSFIDKHNHYARLEAQTIHGARHEAGHVPAETALSPGARARRWLKRHVLPRLPFIWLWRFTWMYVLQRGFLDGHGGLAFCRVIATYDRLVAIYLKALRTADRDGTTADLTEPRIVRDARQHRPGDVGVTIRRTPKPLTLQPIPAARRRREDHVTIRDMEPFPLEERAEDTTTPGVSVMILTLNEETNIEACLDSVTWCDDVVVFDSHSADDTVELAKQKGVRVVQRPFDNWSTHQNWAMENITFRHDWVFYLDADERMTPELLEEITAIAADDDNPHAAYYVGRKNYFMGKWIKHSMPPGLIMRFFRPPNIRFERLVNPTPVLEGTHGYLKHMFRHYNFSKGVTEWLDKHNKYSLMEAMEGIKLLRGEQGEEAASIFSSDKAIRRKGLKNLSFRLPFRPFIKFLYMYFVRLGFLDGRAGITYCTLQAIYEYMIVLKMKELKMREKGLEL
ncbi:MAG: glycosyltransferase family 2 protein [Planctomycetota bacterium]|jgi:glycosyltransferase involved in cell wall biosynthesis